MNINLQNLAALRNRFRCKPSTNRILVRSYATTENSSNIHTTGEKLLECYRVLNLSQTCTKEELKSRYLDLAKKYHPDTGGKTADVDAFRRLHSAYKFIVDNDYGTRDRQELENVPKIFDIRHTAPQHRQYLEYGGVGHGTPAQRMRQYQQHRVQTATENVNEYMINKILANESDYSLISKTVEEREYARKWKTKGAVDRLVEDLIQESMRRGEFENLSGKGKPLAYETHNPYLDSMTHKLNQVLIQNGFCPEWVLMEKEIRTEITRIRDSLAGARQKLETDSYYLSRPAEQELQWSRTVAQLRDDCVALNKRIDSFNLLVPSLHKQMVHFSLDKELKKITTKSEGEKTSDCGTVKEKNDTTLPRSNSDAKEADGDKERREKSGGIFRMLFYAMTHDKSH